ncbi:MAG: citrate/2-methylcitrate synthase [Nitrospirota bacterium]|nr:citrate/2-methylcitrate synthase [Nitrospirota bacterium]
MLMTSQNSGLEGMVAGESAICSIDEEKSELLYRGYLAEELSEHATFEEVAYLLLKGELPSSQALEEWKEELFKASILPDLIFQLSKMLPQDAHPMDTLRTGVSLLGMVDPEATNSSYDANIQKTIKLLAQGPLLVSMASRLNEQKHPFQLIKNQSFAENLLFFLTGDREAAHARELDISLILYAEHELNASTFTARVTASTLADLYGAVMAAIAALKGPLHGGANEAVAQMLTRIGNPGKAKDWVLSALKSKQRIMGFGHRVLKHGDPRSDVMKRRAKALSEKLGNWHWYKMAERVEQTVHEEKGMPPNIDFYTAVVYLLLKIPVPAYTPIFVVSRMSGWCAHITEQQMNNRIIRPRATYTGPPKREFLPISYR